MTDRVKAELPPLQKPNREGPRIRDYMQKKGVTEQGARDLVVRDLLKEKYKDKARKYEGLALLDPLTGRANRRWLLGDDGLTGELPRLFDLAVRHHHELSVFMIDIDDFKAYNDDFEHQEGDRALKLVADLIDSHVRTSDFVARYGGEEFAVVVPETDLNHSRKLAERLRNAVEDSTEFKRGMSVSIGIAHYPWSDTGDDPNSLMNRADQAMYAAKNMGKNRVEVWEPQEQIPQEALIAVQKSHEEFLKSLEGLTGGALRARLNQHFWRGGGTPEESEERAQYRGFVLDYLNPDNPNNEEHLKRMGLDEETIAGLRLAMSRKKPTTTNPDALKDYKEYEEKRDQLVNKILSVNPV